MKIAITAVGGTPDDEVDPRLGRCAYFLIYDVESKQYQAVSNEAANQSGGAGVAAAQLVQGNGAEVVLTGNAGPNAFSTLQAAGVKVVVGVSGKVQEAVEKYLAGEYKSVDEASVKPHFGMGPKQ